MHHANLEKLDNRHAVTVLASGEDRAAAIAAARAVLDDMEADPSGTSYTRSSVVGNSVGYVRPAPALTCQHADSRAHMAT